MLGAITSRSHPQARQLGHFLQGVLLVLVLAVAYATPPEPLHLAGIQDGGDYDSLIQPLVLLLAGLPVTEVPLLTWLGPRPTRAIPSLPSDLPAPVHRGAESRAPPIL
jgi:hypothetical protein